MNDFRVLVTGSRSTTPRDDMVIRRVLDEICGEPDPNRPVVIIEGDCPFGGADVTARMWARERPYTTFEEYPAKWYLHGKKAGPVRNQEMVDTGAAICLAFPSPTSEGTWDCLKRAALAGIPGRVYPVTGEPPVAAATLPGVDG